MAIWSVYKSGNRHRFYEIWEAQNDSRESGIIIGRDFNFRIGEKGGLIEKVGKSQEVQKKSKNKIISNGGRKFVDFYGREGWSILNVNTVGDKEG